MSSAMPAEDPMELPHPLIPMSQAPLTTREGWREWVLHVPAKVEMMTEKEWQVLDQRERRLYDQLRLDAHADLGPIRTQQVQGIIDELELLTSVNRSKQSGARTGAVIDAQGFAGKTTILKMSGRSYERELREDYGWGVTVPRTASPSFAGLSMDEYNIPTTGDGGSAGRTLSVVPEPVAMGAEFLPVAYITVPAKCTMKTLAASGCNFYGVPISTTRSNTEDLVEAFVRAAIACATSLIIVDDVHFLQMTNQSNRDVNNLLKELANKIPATFVYAGIGCERSGLFSEGRAVKDLGLSQTSTRFMLLPLRSSEIETAEGRKNWQSILRTLESKLYLHGAYDGMLCQDLVEYLYERSNGVMGSLTELLRRGAALGIKESKGKHPEVLTTSLLDRVRVDYYAQSSEDISPSSRRRRR